MILVQFAVAATILAAALTVMAWVADRGEPTCDVSGCNDPPAVLVHHVSNGDIYAACSRCAEELTARFEWSW